MLIYNNIIILNESKDFRRFKFFSNENSAMLTLL